MTDPQRTIEDRYGWLSFPLLMFAASRALLFAFAKAGPLFGGQLGVSGALPKEFSAAYPTWAALGHGEISGYARIARHGYAGAADVLFGPLVPLLGKGLGAVVGSIELGLMLLSLIACAVGFAGVYRLFEELRNHDTARWGLAVLAAFPLSYHLSDGSALACLLAFSTWGVLLALRGSHLLAAALLSLGALAHPACAILSLAAVALPSRLGEPASAGVDSFRPFRQSWSFRFGFGGLSRWGRIGDGIKVALLAPLGAGRGVEGDGAVFQSLARSRPPCAPA